MVIVEIHGLTLTYEKKIIEPIHPLLPAKLFTKYESNMALSKNGNETRVW
jgi:hypothetical protein